MAIELALSEVAAGVFELRLPIPFEDGLVNVFLFRAGSEVDLLDCGMSSEDSLEAIQRALEQLGARRLRRLVVTHIHPDHYGAAGVLAGPGRADLYMHRLEVPLVHPRYVELEHLIEEVKRYLLVNGVPDEEAEVLSNSQRALSQLVTPADPSVQLDGAELIEMGDHVLKVEWTPGHSPGHICLFDGGVRARTSTRSAWPSRKASRTSRPSRSKAASPSRSRPSLCAGGCLSSHEFRGPALAGSP